MGTQGDKPLTDRQIVEAFHLVFLGVLARGPDRSLFTLKGGVNLRFFFESIRYSQDMDLDVTVTSPTTLKNKVERLLASPALLSPLRSLGITVSRRSAPKQTDTTQRWKIELMSLGRAVGIPTKVEFSRRGSGGDAEVAQVGRRIAEAYRATPPLVSHYVLETALAQKVEALAGRPEAQARDVFDLDLLFRRAGGKLDQVPRLGAKLRAAVERVTEVSHDDFVAEVVAFLEPAEAEPFSTKQAWEELQLRVLDDLGRLSK